MHWLPVWLPQTLSRSTRGQGVTSETPSDLAKLLTPCWRISREQFFRQRNVQVPGNSSGPVGGSPQFAAACHTGPQFSARRAAAGAAAISVPASPSREATPVPAAARRSSLLLAGLIRSSGPSFGKRTSGAVAGRPARRLA